MQGPRRNRNLKGLPAAFDECCTVVAPTHVSLTHFDKGHFVVQHPDLLIARGLWGNFSALLANWERAREQQCGDLEQQLE